MKDIDLPPDTIATMSHGRTTIQAWWRPGVTKLRALSWSVNGGPEVDQSDPPGELIGFWKMAAAGHVGPPWRLTEYGKALAGECPCGSCGWTDPPERTACPPPKRRDVGAKERRRIRREKDRRIAAFLEAQERRIRELEASAEERERLLKERVARLTEELRQERAERERLEAERAEATRTKLRRAVAERAEAIRSQPRVGGKFVKAGTSATEAEAILAAEARRPRAGGQFVKAGAPAPSAEAVSEKRSRAGKARAAGAARVSGRFVKKGDEGQ